MVKKRTSGGGLGVILAQHFDTGIDLVRRLTGELVARFDKIGMDSDPQIVTGTIGRRMGSFLMQLVASPTDRPAYGHLWGVGGVPAIYNGDGTATPIFDAWANADNDVAALTVDIGTQTVANGDVGIIMRGSLDDAQNLVFLNGGGAGGGSSGSGSYYGDGSDGSMTVPSDTTSWSNFAFGKQTSGGDGLPFGIPDGTYVWGIPAVAVTGGVRDLWCTSLTIPAGTMLAVAGPRSRIRCTGTLTVNGVLSAGGDVFAYLNGSSFQPGAWFFGSFHNTLAGRGHRFGSATDGRAGDPVTGMPYDEGPQIPDSTKFSGPGGVSSPGTDPPGVGKGGCTPPAKPGDGGAGLASGSSWWLRSLPGAAFGQGLTTTSLQPFTTGASSGGGGGGELIVASRGGDGGAGGCLLVICSKSIVGSGTITADGGRGMPGDIDNAGIPGGGGGGGNPGGISIVTEGLSGSLTVSHAPGVGGAGSPTGGSAGTAGGGSGWGQVINPVSGTVTAI